MSIQDTYTVTVLHSTPGNDWETGRHNVAPSGTKPKIVTKGMTYFIEIRNARGQIVTSNLKYQTGSGITHDSRGREMPLDPLDVIAAIVRDAECGEYTFDEFCDSLGYDTDSRSALETYLICQTRASELARGFTPAELAELREFTATY